MGRSLYIYTISNKVYVGKTVSLKKRWSNHISCARRCATNQYIHRAMRKYGLLMAKNGSKTKLTEEQVLEIFQLYREGEHSQRQIGEMFGISQGQVWRILHRKRWKFLEVS